MIKKSKIAQLWKASPDRPEGGLASIVIVGVMVILLTLISLGFAKIVDRHQRNSLSHQLSVGATYAAQSGVNDVLNYLKTVDHNATSSKCGDLIGTASSPGPLYSASNISGDSSRTVSYSCVLISQHPQSLVFGSIPSNKSQVVKLDAGPPANGLKKVMFSWKASDPTKNAFPTDSSLPLSSETYWAGHRFAPVLRVSLYPVAAGDLTNSAYAHGRTIFLYPQCAPSLCPGAKGSNNVTSISYPAQDGTLQPVDCGIKNIPGGGFKGNAEYDCSVIIDGLDNVTPGGPAIDYYFARITPLYENADVSIKGNDKGAGVVNFNGVQAVVDVTAKNGTSVKRLQARADTSSLNGGTDFNISPNDNNIPEYSIRSAGSLCKRLLTSSAASSIDSPFCPVIAGATPPPGTPPPGTPPPGPITELSNLDVRMVNASFDSSAGILHLSGQVNPHNIADVHYWFWFNDCSKEYPPGFSAPVSGDGFQNVSYDVNPWSFYYCGYNNPSSFKICANTPLTRGITSVCSSLLHLYDSGTVVIDPPPAPPPPAPTPSPTPSPTPTPPPPPGSPPPNPPCPGGVASQGICLSNPQVYNNDTDHGGANISVDVNTSGQPVTLSYYINDLTYCGGARAGCGWGGNYTGTFNGVTSAAAYIAISAPAGERYNWVTCSQVVGGPAGPCIDGPDFCYLTGSPTWSCPGGGGPGPGPGPGPGGPGIGHCDITATQVGETEASAGGTCYDAAGNPEWGDFYYNYHYVSLRCGTDDTQYWQVGNYVSFGGAEGTVDTWFNLKGADGAVGTSNNVHWYHNSGLC